MKVSLASLGVAAALALAPAAQAQDIAGAFAGALDQFGQSMGESVMQGESIFVSAVGKTALPGGASGIVGQPITLSFSGEGETAAEAARARDEQVAKVQEVARRFGVTAEVGKTSFAYGEAFAMTDSFDWDMFDTDMATATDTGVDVELIEPVTTDEPTEPSHTFTATAEVTVGRPAEARMAAFVDALAEAGVPSFNDTSVDMSELGALGMWAGLLGMAAPADPGEGVWSAATADAMARARVQAEQVASAAGRSLGQVKNVTVYLRHQDGGHAYVTLSARFGFAD